MGNIVYLFESANGWKDGWMGCLEERYFEEEKTVILVRYLFFEVCHQTTWEPYY